MCKISIKITTAYYLPFLYKLNNKIPQKKKRDKEEIKQASNDNVLNTLNTCYMNFDNFITICLGLGSSLFLLDGKISTTVLGSPYLHFSIIFFLLLIFIMNNLHVT